eukprot:Em0009g1250a
MSNSLISTEAEVTTLHEERSTLRTREWVWFNGVRVAHRYCAPTQLMKELDTLLKKAKRKPQAKEKREALRSKGGYPNPTISPLPPRTPQPLSVPSPLLATVDTNLEAQEEMMVVVEEREEASGPGDCQFREGGEAPDDNFEDARRFFQQRKFKALLAAKKEQEQLLADFLSGVPKSVEGLYPRQMALCEEDLERPKEALLKARNTINQVPVIAPPSDINAPPPEPYIKDDDSAWAQDSDEVARRSVDEDGFVAVSKGNRFGPEGTRNASLRWFKETQARHVLRADGTVCEWFHGFISKRRSEELLDGKPEGSYLVRTNDTHFGYHLSIRKGKRGCGHYLISQLEAGKFVLAGEHKVHRGLVQLLEHHMRYPMSDNTCLTQPCCNQPGSCQELLGGADLSPPAPSPKGAGRRGVPPPPSHPEIQQKRSKLNSIDSKPLQQVF